MDAADLMRIAGMAPEEPADETSAADVDPTATTTPEDDGERLLTIDEALAALDGDVAPPDETDTEPPADDDPTALLSADAIAAIVRENEQFKATIARAQAVQADTQFNNHWEEHLDYGEDWYEQQRESIRRLGMQQGRSADEIDLAIYRRVEQGQGLVDPQSRAPVMGYLQWKDETDRNRVAATAQYLAQKTAPSALDQMTAKYGLDAEDRTALAKFVNLPPQPFEELARTLGSKTQRLAFSLQAAKQQANRNVAANLTSQAIAPGAPGAAPMQPRVQLDTSRKSTEFVGKALGLVR